MFLSDFGTLPAWQQANLDRVIKKIREGNPPLKLGLLYYNNFPPELQAMYPTVSGGFRIFDPKYIQRKIVLPPVPNAVSTQVLSTVTLVIKQFEEGKPATNIPIAVYDELPPELQAMYPSVKHGMRVLSYSASKKFGYKSSSVRSRIRREQSREGFRRVGNKYIPIPKPLTSKQIAANKKAKELRVRQIRIMDAVNRMDHNDFPTKIDSYIYDVLTDKEKKNYVPDIDNKYKLSPIFILDKETKKKEAKILWDTFYKEMLDVYGMPKKDVIYWHSTMKRTKDKIRQIGAQLLAKRNEEKGQATYFARINEAQKVKAEAEAKQRIFELTNKRNAEAFQLEQKLKSDAILKANALARKAKEKKLMETPFTPVFIRLTSLNLLSKEEQKHFKRKNVQTPHGWDTNWFISIDYLGTQIAETRGIIETPQTLAVIAQEVAAKKPDFIKSNIYNLLPEEVKKEYKLYKGKWTRLDIIAEDKASIARKKELQALKLKQEKEYKETKKQELTAMGLPSTLINTIIQSKLSSEMITAVIEANNAGMPDLIKWINGVWRYKYPKPSPQGFINKLQAAVEAYRRSEEDAARFRAVNKENQRLLQERQRLERETTEFNKRQNSLMKEASYNTKAKNKISARIKEITDRILVLQEELRMLGTPSTWRYGVKPEGYDIKKAKINAELKQLTMEKFKLLEKSLTFANDRIDIGMESTNNMLDQSFIPPSEKKNILRKQTQLELDRREIIRKKKEVKDFTQLVQSRDINRDPISNFFNKPIGNIGGVEIKRSTIAMVGGGLLAILLI